LIKISDRQIIGVSYYRDIAVFFQTASLQASLFILSMVEMENLREEGLTMAIETKDGNVFFFGDSCHCSILA